MDQIYGDRPSPSHTHSILHGGSSFGLRSSRSRAAPRKGDPLSPLLWATVVDFALRHARAAGAPGFTIGQRTPCQILCYADDIALFAHSHATGSGGGLRVAEEVGITAGWGETDVLMEVSSWRLAPVQHRHLPARGLLSLFSFLRAFLLTAIKRNRHLTARPHSDERRPALRLRRRGRVAGELQNKPGGGPRPWHRGGS